MNFFRPKMRMLGILLIAMVAAGGLRAQDARPAAPTHWALIVAVDEFAGSRYRTDFAEDGARELASLLTGQFGYQPETVVGLFGSRASAENIFNALERLLRQIRPGDTFLAYFATPTSVNNYGETFLAPYEGIPERAINMVPLAKLLYWLQEQSASATLVVFEDCVGEEFSQMLRKKSRRVGAINSIFHRSCLTRGYDPDSRRYFSEAFRAVLQRAADESTDLPFPRLFRLLQSRLKFSLESVDSGADFVFTVRRPAGGTGLLDRLSRENSTRDRIDAIGELLNALQMRQDSNPQARRTLGEALTKIATDKSEDVAVRVRAIEALGQMNYSEGLGELAGLLEAEGEDNVRILLTVLQAIEQMRSPQTVAFFREALQHPAPTVRKEAIRVLAFYRDSDAGDEILAMLARESDEEVLVAALESLPQFEIPPGAEMGSVIRLLQHPSAGVRRTAVGALADVKVVSAVPAVIRALLQDPDAEVRSRAAYALSNLVQPDNRESITSALREALKNDEVPSVKVGAVFSLGEMGATAAEKDLRRALSRDENVDVRKAAIEALGKLGSEAAVGDLITLLRDPAWTIRRESARALGQIGDNRAVEPLLAATKDPDYYVRQAASTALDQIWGRAKQAPAPEPDNLAALRKSLADPSPAVRVRAVEQLATYRLPEVVPDLVEMIDDPDYQVREAAIAALQHFEDENAISLVITALQSRNFLKRQGAVKILGSGGEMAHLVHLLPLSDDPNSAVRAELARALGNFSTTDVLDPLLRALTDEDAAVRTAAAQSLAGQIFRLRYQGDQPRADAVLEKAYPLIESRFAEEHPWRRWYNVLVLRSPEKPWGVDLRLQNAAGAQTIFDAPERVHFMVENTSGDSLYYVILNLSTSGKMTLVNDPGTLLKPQKILRSAVEVYLPSGHSHVYDLFKVIACREPVEPFELANALNPERKFGKGRLIFTSPLAGMIAGYRKFTEKVEPGSWETAEKVVVVRQTP